MNDCGNMTNWVCSTFNRIGPISATAERTQTVSLLPIIGWLLIGGGACVRVFAALLKI
jgi:hypothetical protein